MSKLFQIKEDDLATLEQSLPILAEGLMPVLNNRLRTHIRKVQQVVAQVRWGYGPPSEVEVIPAEGDKE